MAWSAPTVLVLRPVASAALSPPPGTERPTTETPETPPTDGPTPVETTSPTQAATSAPTDVTETRPREIVARETPDPLPTGRRRDPQPARAARRPGAGARAQGLAATGTFVGAAAAAGAAAVAAGGAAARKARRMETSDQDGEHGERPGAGGSTRATDDVE